MASRSANDVGEHVAERVRAFSAAKTADLWSCYLDRDLRMDPEDFIELCEELERTFEIDLRPFFEDGQPERRWWFFWKHPVARDVTVGELISHIEGLVAPKQ